MLLLLVGLNLFFAGFQFYHSYMHWLFNNRALRYKLNVDKRRNPSELCIMQSLALHSNQYKSIRRQEKAWVWVFNLSYHLRCVGFDLFPRLTGYRTLRYHRVHPLYHLGILNAPWVFIACRMLLFSAHASSCSLAFGSNYKWWLHRKKRHYCVLFKQALVTALQNQITLWTGSRWAHISEMGFGCWRKSSSCYNGGLFFSFFVVVVCVSVLV